MKVRNGFVSNSSSSSFVISTNKTDEEIYNDIYYFFEKYTQYQNFLAGSDKDVTPSLERIKECVDILRADNNGNIGDTFVYTWYTEDHDQPSDFFKDKIVIYGDDNFLPSDIDNFYWMRHLYSQDYKYYDSCTHMG